MTAPDATATASTGGATRIQLCGRLKADVRGRHVTPELRGRQGRVLLAFLVLNRGRPVSRDELIASIWPDEVPADPPAALRTQLSRLRSALGAESLAGRDAVELHLPEDTWIDLEAAEQANVAAQAALQNSVWAEAWAHAHVSLNISGRPFLAGFEAPWVEEVRSELAELHMRSREIVARAGIGLGGSELAGAERAARALIRAAPFRESGYLLLMRALVESGNTAEALRTFDRLRHLLADELGSAPGAEIQALHRRLLSAQPAREEAEREAGGGDDTVDPAAQTAAPAELPLPIWLRAERQFVGRAEEMAGLDDAWASAAAGGREIVLVGGEPGVGKTSLATEFADRVHTRGGRVLYGRTDEHGSLRLQPFVEALRHWGLNAPVAELRRDLGSRPGPLLALVPEIAVRLDESPPDAGTPTGEELLEAVVGTLTAIARDRPLLLVIDDLHWADSDSLLALRRIARSPHRGGLLIVATHREAEPSETLAETLADLGREHLFRRIHLTGLTVDEVSELVAEIRGEPADPRLAAAIHAETDGNPFLVEALASHATRGPVALGAAGGASPLYADGVPDLVRDAVGHRVAELGEAAQSVLEVAAVIGREFELGLVAELSEMRTSEVAAALEAGIVAQLVTDVPGTFDRYAFSHALYRQTIYVALPRARRTELHRMLGALLEERHGDDPRHLSQLARQFANAGPDAAPKAVEYGVRAGAGALGALAYETAVSHYRDALNALDSGETAQDDLRCELLIALGDAEWIGGDDGAAAETHARAARLARLSGRPDALGRAALGFCRSGFELLGPNTAEARELLESALEANPAKSALRARLLARRAELEALEGDPAAATTSDEAMSMARATGDEGATAATLVGRWYGCLGPGGLEERRLLTQELLDSSGAGRDVELVAWRLAAAVAIETGDPAALDSAITRHRQLAERRKDERAALQNRALMATRALMRGSLDEAEGITAELLQPGLTGSLGPGAMLLTILRWERGEIEEMESALRELVARLDRPAWSALLALALAEMGESAEARGLIEELSAPGRLDREPAGVPVLLAMAVCSIRADDLAAPVAAALEPLAGTGALAGVATAYLGPVDHHLGALLALGGSEDGARKRLEAAAGFSAAAQTEPWEARSCAALTDLG